MARDPYWFALPPGKFDIARLRPPSLEAGQRFETVGDTQRESLRSEAVLRKSRATLWHADTLNDCRERFYDCQKPFCPACARRYRRWLIGQLSALYSAEDDVTVVTILLETSGDIRPLDPPGWRRALRHRIGAAKLAEEVIAGGFEVSWRWREKVWVLHAHLLIPNCSPKQYKALSHGIDDVPLNKPVEGQRLTDRADQISYVSKFTTYHRPGRQFGDKKPEAKPLNPSQHRELVQWMGQFAFADFLFLFGCRRVGEAIRSRPP